MRARYVAGLLSLGAAVVALSPADAVASSHREAPFITKNPKVDASDFYLFQSYESGHDGMTTIIANYLPLQDAYGGPNYFGLDTDALYEINIDNDGDAKEDITFQFQFSDHLADVQLAVPSGGDAGSVSVSVPTVQVNVGATNADAGQTPIVAPVTAANEATTLNVIESYGINIVRGGARTGTSAQVTNKTTSAATFVKPIDYIGSKTLGNAAAYTTYAQAHVYPLSIPGCTPVDSAVGHQPQVFVGQRAEGFRVNLGLIFDLVNAPLGDIVIAPSAFGTTNFNAFGVTNANPYADTNLAFDNLANKNVTSIAIEVPTKCLVKDGAATASTTPVIGGWTAASVRQARVINPEATYGTPSKEGGAWTQVSRLGHPLVNEVVIGLKDKDRFNSSAPSGDAQFAAYVTNPTLPQILEDLFGSANAPFPNVTRNDLVTIFLQGITGVNSFTANAGVTSPAVAEELRLNTAAGFGPTTAAAQAANPFSFLGAAVCFPNHDFTPATSTTGCDTSGFPNGRRPGDDVVDIELTALLGYFLPTATAPASGDVITDLVQTKSSQFDTSFPYLKIPHSGDQ